MLREQTYPYRRCKDSNWDIIVRWDGFDAHQLRTQHNQAPRRGLAGELWLLGCWANTVGG
jgi:hypothetical protein